MKKFVALPFLLFAIALVVSLTSCSSDSETAETPPVQFTEELSPAPNPESSTLPAFNGLTSVSLQNDVYHLSWELAIDDQTEQDSIIYEIFESDSAGIENYDFLNPVTSVVGAASIDVSGLDMSSRHYFIVRASDDDGNSDQNTIEQTQRDLGLSGAPNFRDLGGYINADGAQIKWEHIYRSGDLTTLADTETAIVNDLGLNIIVDIRSHDDIDRDGYDKTYAGNEEIYDFLYCNSGDPVFLADLPDHPLKKLAVDVRLVDYPNWYVNILEQNKEGIKAAFEHYADPSAYPILVHCTQGKDRAGVVSALLLLLLDVPESTIVDDFLLTCDLTAKDIEERMAGLEGILPVLDIVPEGITAEDWRPMLECPQDAMENLLNHVETTYGEVESFLESIGITLEQQQTIKDVLLKE